MGRMQWKGLARVALVGLIGLGACNAILGNEEIDFVAADGSAPGPSDAALDAGADAADACPSDLQTNGEHCGRCGRSCGGSSCRDGACAPQLLTQGYGVVRRLAVDDDALYFTSTDQQLLGRMAKDGGVVSFLEPDGGLIVPSAGLVVDGAFVYASAVYGAGVRRIPKTGGAAETIEKCNTTYGVALDATHVYWHLSLCGGEVRVRRRAKNVLDETLTEEEAAPRPGGAFAQELGGDIVVDDSRVYWMSLVRIMSLPKIGFTDAGVAVLFDRPDGGVDLLRGLAVADRLYVLMGERVIAVPKGGGDASVLADAPATGDNKPATLVLAGSDVYFTRPAKGIVARVPMGGGPVETIASGQPTPSALTVDAQFVYWSNDSDGSIWRVAR